MVIRNDRSLEVVVRPRRGAASALPALVLAVVTAVAAPAAATRPSADGYPPRGVHVVSGTVDNDIVPPGDDVVLRGEGFAPRAVVRLSLDGRVAGTVTADATGTAEARFVLHEPGERKLAVSGVQVDGGVLVVSAPVLVVRSVALPSAVARSSTAPSSAAPGLASGFALVVLMAGALFVLRARPRRAVVGR